MLSLILIEKYKYEVNTLDNEPKRRKHMATAPRFDITATQGSSVYLQFTLKNRDTAGNDTPMDLTNKTLAGQVRSSYDSATAYNFDLTIADAAAGQIVVYMGGDITASMPTGPLVYDIEVADISDPTDIFKPLWGSFYCKQEVTK